MRYWERDHASDEDWEEVPRGRLVRTLQSTYGNASAALAALDDGTLLRGPHTEHVASDLDPYDDEPPTDHERSADR